MSANGENALPKGKGDVFYTINSLKSKDIYFTTTEDLDYNKWRFVYWFILNINDKYRYLQVFSGK